MAGGIAEGSGNAEARIFRHNTYIDIHNYFRGTISSLQISLTNIIQLSLFRFPIIVFTPHTVILYKLHPYPHMHTSLLLFYCYVDRSKRILPKLFQMWMRNISNHSEHGRLIN